MSVMAMIHVMHAWLDFARTGGAGGVVVDQALRGHERIAARLVRYSGSRYCGAGTPVQRDGFPTPVQ